jgi:Concanavalin A-like lectin/glucanases superfamily
VKHRIIPFLAALLLSWFLPALAFAACSGPAGNAGDTIYNSPYHVLQYCDGATWHAMGPTGAGGSGCAPSSGLVGWWKFDETSGTSAADSSGNGNTGTLQAAASWTAGKINGALYFNGTTQFVTASDSASLDLAGSWTVSAWVNLTALPTSGNEAMLVGKPTSATGGPNYAIDVDNTGGVISWEVWFVDTVNGNHTIDYNATINLNINTWYQVTGVWDNSAKKLYLYVNGVQVGSTLNIPALARRRPAAMNCT